MRLRGDGKKTGVFKGKWTDDDTTAGILLGGTWQKPGGKETDFSAEQQNIYFSENLSLTTRKIAENNKQKLYEIDAEYPELSGAVTAKKQSIKPSKQNLNFIKFLSIINGIKPNFQT